MDWADPFPVEHDGRRLVFVEEHVRSARRGRICVVELDSPGAPAAPVPVLELGHHLSYPLVFRWEDAWYLMPEQARTGRLDVYRATQFPTSWAWDRTVLELPAVDATLAYVDDRWWLFAALATAPGGAADELHLFHAQTPLGPWEPHVANPIVSDVRTARPAGRLIRAADGWYRPAQNGGPIYGYSIMLERILRLDVHGYREAHAAEIQPGWASEIPATHTVNRDGRLAVLDARVREPRIRWPVRGRTRQR
jgi:hypothetical protein